MNLKLEKLVLGLVLLLWVAAIYAGELPAFPGAEGFGRFTSGGRGGAVLEVTNLGDSGPGSLRAAIETRGPRTIIFRIAGTIALSSELVINHDSLTVAGQSAPGGGICIKNYPLIIAADDVIIRYLRSRLGDERRQQADALSGLNHKNIIIDHCSFSWGTDEAATLRDNENTTMQWCIISESLNHSIHEKGDHGYGGIWGGKGASFHHNLLAHHASRNPRFHGSRYHGEPDKELVDFRNNVIYNWGFNSSYGGEAGQQNLVNNYYKAGPASEHRNRIVEAWDDKGKWYIAGNYVDGYPEISVDNWAGGVQGKQAGIGHAAAPFPAAPVMTQSAQEAFLSVLAGAGATLPARDAVDCRIIGEVRSGNATFGGVWGEKRGLIDSQSQVGGWPVLSSAQAPADADHDGMADVWERSHGLDPADGSDCNGDYSGDGYTNLEKYLNGLTMNADSLKAQTAATPASWASRMADSIMKRNPKAYDEWDYVTGTVLKGFEELWRQTGDQRYFSYIQSTVDSVVSTDGIISGYVAAEYNIDQVREGTVLLFLARETGQPRYKIAVDQLRQQLREHPRTKSGGFWHKQRYPWQMWLDGLYMGSPFYANYAAFYNEPAAFDDVVRQFTLIEEKARDPKTGLLYHGWDESGQQSWANPATGCSANFWGRGLGWYAMALVDVLDYLPANHAGRDSLIQILNRLAPAIAAVQDSQTGLWWQVLDQGAREGNYLESSASAMFVYALAKGVRLGYLNPSWLPVAEKGFQGMIHEFVKTNGDGTFSLTKTCTTAGLGYGRDGSYDYYVHQTEYRDDDGKGLGPFILASVELELLRPCREK